MPGVPDVTPVPSEIVLMLEQMDSSPITVSQNHTWTRRDPILSQFYHFIQNGWTSTVPPEFYPFFTKKDEFSIVDNCSFWGNCLVIPNQGRKLLLDELHEAHPGTSRMKSRACML